MSLQPEAEFKEFEPRFEFETRLIFIKFRLSLFYTLCENTILFYTVCSNIVLFYTGCLIMFYLIMVQNCTLYSTDTVEFTRVCTEQFRYFRVYYSVHCTLRILYSVLKCTQYSTDTAVECTRVYTVQYGYYREYQSVNCTLRILQSVIECTLYSTDTIECTRVYTVQ